MRVKIPNSKILLAFGTIGSLITAAAMYWIGRRDELDQIINLGQPDGINKLEVKYDGRIPYDLYVRTKKPDS